MAAIAPGGALRGVVEVEAGVPPKPRLCISPQPREERRRSVTKAQARTMLPTWR